MAQAAIAVAASLATVTTTIPTQNAHATFTSRLTVQSQLSNGTVLRGYFVEHS